jgi:hypothetical protein
MSYLRTRGVISFIVKHAISADWLLCGDLKTAQNCTALSLPTPTDVVMKRRRRSIKKRNRQRLAVHSRRLKR